MTAGDINRIAGNGTLESGDGGPATEAVMSLPVSVITDRAGNAVIADSDNNLIRLAATHTGTFYGQKMTAGDIYSIAGSGTVAIGDGGPATKAKLWDPDGVAMDSAGNLLIADSADGRVRLVAAKSGTFYGQKMTADDIYTVAGNGNGGFSGDGGPATKAGLTPDSVAVDGAGNLIVADAQDNRVRMVAVKTGTYYGQKMTAGDIYTIAGNGIRGFYGDGGPATAAEFWAPTDVAVDASGNVLISDSNNFRVRVVAASTGTFYGQNMTAGDIYTIAGNGTGLYSGDGSPATAAGIFPSGLVFDAAGNLLIADTFNYRIRVVAASAGTFYGQSMTGGDIYTIAGDGVRGTAGDGGPATAAELDGPEGVAVNAAGNVLIADPYDNLVRELAG
jgi:sugar lactone lactonase YvrE